MCKILLAVWSSLCSLALGGKYSQERLTEVGGCLLCFSAALREKLVGWPWDDVEVDVGIV